MNRNETVQKINKHKYRLFNIINGNNFSHIAYYYTIINNNAKWVVDCIKCAAIDALIEEYSYDENYKRLNDHLKIKYDKKWFENVTNPWKYKEKGPKEWRKYIKRWDCVKNDIVISDEKTDEWIGKVHLLYESKPDLTEKKVHSRDQRWEYNKEIMQIWLTLFNEIKEDIRPIVSQLDFSWNKDFVTTLISDSNK